MSKDDTLRDLIGASLAVRDKRADECPVNRPSWKYGAKPCPKCGAGTGQSCSLIDGANYSFVTAVRAHMGTGG